MKINGRNGPSSGRRNSMQTHWADIAALLKAGENTIEITSANMPPDEGRLVSVKSDTLPDADSPAGLVLYAYVRCGEQVCDFVSDRGWTVSGYPKPPNTQSGLSAPPDMGKPVEMGPAVELGGLDLAPWKLGSAFLDVAAAAKDSLPVERASLVAADPLMLALGRPNREQVVTVRQTTPTTLQALELTNGGTLAKILKQGAEKILAANGADSAALVDALYRQTLSRKPAAKEQQLALRVVGSPAKAEGVEDLLWALAMLPEFQLIN
jgi:hypothetical protein